MHMIAAVRSSSEVACTLKFVVHQEFSFNFFCVQNVRTDKKFLALSRPCASRCNIAENRSRCWTYACAGALRNAGVEVLDICANVDGLYVVWGVALETLFIPIASALATGLSSRRSGSIGISLLASDCVVYKLIIDALERGRGRSNASSRSCESSRSKLVSNKSNPCGLDCVTG